MVLKVSVYIVPKFPHIVPETSDHNHQGFRLVVLMRTVPVPSGNDRPRDPDDEDAARPDALTDLC